MKNTKTKIILSVIIFLSVIGFIGTANAAGVSLYISPASITKTAGDTFNVSVGFNASGGKVCAVEGTLVFNNLSCQSITVSGDIDIVKQSSPTCSNPHFLIGIQNCTTSDRVLLTASVKAGSAGTASVSATGVDIIGEGVSVGSASTSGNYTINAVPKLTPTPTTPTPTAKTTPKTEISPIPTLSPSPAESPTVVAQATPGQSKEQGYLLAAIGNVLSFGTGKTWLLIVVVILILAAIACVAAYFIKKTRKPRP